MPLQVVGKLLGHAVIATTEHHAYLSDDPVRQANKWIEDHLWGMMSGSEAGVVAICQSPAARKGDEPHDQRFSWLYLA